MKIPKLFRRFACWWSVDTNSSTSGATGEGLKQDFEDTPFVLKGVKHEFEDIPGTGAVLKQELGDTPFAGGSVKQDFEDTSFVGRGAKHEFEDIPGTGAVVKQELGDIPSAGGGVKQDLEDIPVANEDVKQEFEDIPGTRAVVKQEFGDIPSAGGGVKQDLEDILVSNEDVKQEFEGIPFIPEKGFYQPSTEETWEAYQALITLVEAQSQANLPDVVMCGVADEVLSVLKCNNIKTLRDKKAEIEKILNPIPHFLFSQMVSTANLITDYYYGQVVMFVHEKDFYLPKSEDTCTAYKLLLDLVNSHLAYQHQQIQQCVLAHKVLEILNDEKMEKSKKRKEIEYTLTNGVSDDTFDTILFVGELITDFKDGRKGGGHTTFGADVARKAYLSESSIRRWRPMVEGFDYGGQIDVDGVYGVDDSTDDDDEPVNLVSGPMVDVEG